MSPSARVRSSVESWHPPVQTPSSVHEVHAQYNVLEQELVQFEVSFEKATSHFVPQWFASCSMKRERYLCPPHFEQEPHLDHALQRQSMQTSFFLLHGNVLQPTVTDKFPSQGLPPPVGSLIISRVLLCCPPLQGFEHEVQSDHWSRTQSCLGSSPHPVGDASCSLGLHGSICFKGSSTHSVPLPEANTPIRRFRSRIPEHVQLHGDQSPQSVS